MSSTEPSDVNDVREWLEALGLPIETEEARPLTEQLRDGALLCQLVNRIRPGSVENIKPRRSSGDAEENILRFLQACTSLGVKKIFRPADLLDGSRDFGSVLVTLQQLYRIASGLGMGIRFTRLLPKQQVQQNGSVTSPSHVGDSGESSPTDADEEHDEMNGVEHVVKAIYAFGGASEDELQFEKGDLITVTKVVDGGWWEGICNGRIGWFPGNYAEELPDPVDPNQSLSDKRESAQLYHNLVIQDIVDSERTYVHDLHMLLSTYLVPLKTANVVSARDVDLLTGNLPELIRWQQSFLKSLEDCSRLPIPLQNMGTRFLHSSQEIEGLYSAYCANHPRAVAVLTDNSDKLSAFMESRGAASPGMLTLTSNLSKPFRRLEKYQGLLKELQRHLTEGHADADNVAAAIEAYTAISARTQEIRKRKEMEHEMLSNPVQGYSGQCLMELGECACVLQANQAVSSEEVDERFLLVFPGSLVILGVGQTLSGYELKANLSLASITVKTGGNSEYWPFPIEIHRGQDVIHASFSTMKERTTLMECVGRHTGDSPAGVARAPHRTPSSSKAFSFSSRASSASLFRSAYAPRAMRNTAAPIKRAHHWGFKSLQPAPPLSTQQLMALRERDLKSPKSAKKFIYPVVKKKRSSKAIEDVLAAGISRPIVDNCPGDTAILRVIEAYCSSGKIRAMRTSQMFEGTDGPGRDKRASITVEVQVKKMSDDLEQLKMLMQQEIRARVHLETRFQVFADKLGPIIVSPTPQ